MQNIDVRFNATSSFGKVKADLAALEAQAASLRAVFASNAYAKPPGAVDPVKWQIATNAVHRASNVYRDAVSSSGLLTSQQIRATSEAEKYTKALQKQKLALGDIRRHQGIMKEVYRDQLRMQRMTAQYWGTDSAGRAITDITVPRNVPRDLDTVAQKLYFTGQMAKSAGTQIVNTGKNFQWAGRQLTVGLTYPVALFGIAAGVMAYKVDSAMTAVTKVYDVSAEAMNNEAMRVKELNDVRVRSYEVAEEAAKKYGQSIEDTLGVEQALAATGLNGDRLFGSTRAVSRIATLGDLDLTQSTEMTIALQTAFKDTIKTTDDLNDAFNFMNAVENATSLSIQDIAESTPRAASAMAALGVSVEQMTVLLTSMREAGVDAAEGANALKSATGTILAPSPAADNFIKQISNGRVQVTKLAKESGGNLYNALGLLYQQMEGLNDLQKQQVLVKLFGKYQFNRVSAMVTNLGAAFEGTQNQTRKAMDLMGEDAEQLGTRAERELALKMEAVSGRFKAAWQSMRIELAKVGEPFLEIATDVANLTGNVLEFFNGMSDWKKKAVLGVAAVLAIAGPIVMLGGLFMNLGGQFVAGGGKILSVLGRIGGAVGLVTKEEKAATLSAEAQNKVLSQTQTQTTTLAQEISVLTAAYEKATAAARAYAETQGVVAASQAAGVVRTTGPSAVPYGPQLPTPTTPVAYSYARGASAAEKSAARSTAYRSAQMAELNRLAAQEEMNRKAAQEAATREKIRKSINGATIGSGVMAASMVTMMVSSNQTAQNIAKWAMIGTLAVPAMQMLVGGGNALVGSIGRSIVAARTGIASITSMGTAMNVAKAGALGFGRALNAALGPVGWIALGLTAVTGVFLAIKNHNDKIKAQQKAIADEQIAATKVMQSSTESIATNLGKAAGSYRQIANAGGGAFTGRGSQSQMLQSYNYYRSDEGMAETKALQSDGKLIDTDALIDKIRGKFIDLQVLGSDTAEQAKTDVQAMLLAAGASATEAARLADEVYRKYGDINQIDWAKPINDQAAALDGLAREAFQLKSRMITSGSTISIVTDFEIDETAKKQLYAQAEKSSEIFNQALASATSPDEAREIIEQYMQAATREWQVGFDNLMSSNAGGSDKVKALFAQYGIDSGQAFADAMRNNKDFESAYDDLMTSQSVNAQLQAQLQYAERFATEYEHAFISPLAKSSWYLGDTVLTAATALKQFNAAGIGLSSDEAADALMHENQAYQDYATALRQVAELKSRSTAGNSAAMLEAQNRLNEASADLLPIINSLNEKYQFKQGKTAAQALRFLLGHVGVETENVDKKAKSLNRTLGLLGGGIKTEQIGGVLQTAMSNVQGRMADSAMEQFSASWDARTEAAKNDWQARSDDLEASHDAAMERLERSQEDAQDAFDRRWEARQKTIERVYQSRIDRVNRQIDAEKKADDIRQQLFDNEKARLTRLAEMENADIDFNTAINEGRLDDAAKTLNNAGVDAANDQMDAEQKAAEARSAARIDALEKKNERLEKARDKELDNIKRLEDRMRKHLERVQDARRNALEKQQRDESAALERAEDAAMRSMDRQRNYEEAVLQERLELFKSYTARNQKDLERWMKEVGLSYDDFGSDVKAKGESWSKYFRTELSKQIRQAGVAVMNDNIWENVGKQMAKKLVRGLGFSGLADFRHFVKTGEHLKRNERNKANRGPTTTKKPLDVSIYHDGGQIDGRGGSGRGSIPNTFKGLHRTERMVLAQKGEYVVNKKAAKDNLGLLHAINKGSDVAPPGQGGIGGPAGLLSAVVSQMFAKGVQQAFMNNYQVGLAKQNAKLGPGGRFSGKSGTYGGRTFSPEQMKNAAIIAGVGSSMGMSARDIQIGIMTAIAESGLVNVHYGDRDSQGLFQQRPSQGWGSIAQVTNPRYAARAFFGPLKAHEERINESPWLAAQHIQRSAFADGSNYRAWWAAAQDIFKNGLIKQTGINGGYVPGAGGRHRPIAAPVTNGLHGGNSFGNPPAVDMAVPRGRPVYAVADGRITSSRDIHGPLASDSYRGDGPYGSFGRVIQMQTDSGAGILYAHLSRRSVAAGTRVKGGAIIGYSGNTGNSSGPHLHFGATNGPYAWLRRGGEIKYDNTHVVAHRGETMLSAPVTRQLKENIASGGGQDYNVVIDLRGAYIKEDVDIEKAVNMAIDKREAKTGRKRVVT